MSKFDKLFTSVLVFIGLATAVQAAKFADNTLVERTNSITTSGATVTMTIADARHQVLSGTMTGKLKLPNATTLRTGVSYDVVNTSTGSVTVVDGNGTDLNVLSSNHFIGYTLLSNGTAAGSWITRGPVYAGNINSFASWASPDGVTLTAASPTTLVSFTASDSTVSMTADNTAKTFDFKVGTNLANANIAASAAIARSKLATGTAYDVLTNDSGGTMTGVAPGLSGNVLQSNGTAWTSTAATSAFNLLAPTTSKGDLIVHTGATNARQAVGTNGYCLIADSAQTNGVKWDVCGPGATNSFETWDLMGATSVTATSAIDHVTFTSTGGSMTITSAAAKNVNFDILSVARSKIATGTAYDVLTNNSGGSMTGVAPGTSGNILTSDGTQWTSAAPAAVGANELGMLTNVALNVTVSGNAMIISLKGKDGNDPSGSNKLIFGFRNATAGNGTYNQVTVTAATAVTIGSGSTLGLSDAQNEWIYVYAFNNSGTVALGVAGGAQLVDESALTSATAAVTGSGADTRYTVYSTATLTSLPVRLIGKILSNQTTAGTYASAASRVSLAPWLQYYPNSNVECTGTNGFGATDTMIRKFTTCTDTGTAITSSNTANNGAVFTINEEGIYEMHYDDDDTGGMGHHGISLNSTELTTLIYNITAADRLGFAKNYTNNIAQFSTSRRLKPGDKIRPHTDGTQEGTDVRFRIVKVSE